MADDDARRGPLLTVDLDAVAANTRRLAAASGQLMAVVKADGFGHGASPVARTALRHGAAWLGVATLTEAVRLRTDGITAPVLTWLNPVDADWTRALRAGVDLAVPGREHLAAVVEAARGSGVARVHLHADVGMARDGAAPGAWGQLCALARQAEREGRVRVVGVMGHLGWADRPGHPRNADGRRRFEAAVRTARGHGLRPAVRHLAATAAILTDPASRFDLCRAGAGLVGIDPSGTTVLRPAMTLTAPVVGVRDVPAGTPVGYGGTHVTVAPTRLALLPLGYADGVPRAASARGAVWLCGRRRPLAGLVSMDQTVVDVGDAPVDLGDVAVLFGPGDGGEPTVADWARWSGTLPHDLVTGVGPRVLRAARAGGVRVADPRCATVPA